MITQSDQELELKVKELEKLIDSDTTGVIAINIYSYLKFFLETSRVDFKESKLRDLKYMTSNLSRSDCIKFH